MDTKTFAPRKSKPQNYSIVPWNKKQRILVVGAGVFGVWTALMLQRSGYKVCLLDAYGPGNSRSSSGGETRLMRKLYGEDPFYFNMAKESIPYWQELGNTYNQKIFHETGIYWLIKNSGDSFIYHDQEMHSFMQSALEKESKEKAQTRFKSIQLMDVDHVLFEKEAGYLLAKRSTILARDEFVRIGGIYETDYVQPFENSSKLLDLCKGQKDYKFDNYVFACGPWLPKIFPDLFKEEISVTRQEIYYFGYPKNFGDTTFPCWVEWDPENLYYGVPSFEYRGFKIALDERGESIDPDVLDRLVSKESIDRTRDFLAHRFPLLKDSPLIESRVCQYSNTGSGNFILRPHPRFENVLLLGGGNGHGFKHGPAMGKLVAQVVSGEKGIPEELN